MKKQKKNKSTNSNVWDSEEYESGMKDILDIMKIIAKNNPNDQELGNRLRKFLIIKENE